MVNCEVSGYGRALMERPDVIGSPILWTRGQGCGELAVALSGGREVRVTGDLADACHTHRARMVVSRKLSGFDLTNVAVPIRLSLDSVTSVVAAVAGGPHSHLAAEVAHRLGVALSVESFMACAFRDEDSRQSAVSVIESLYSLVPEIEYRLVEATDAEGLIDQLPPGTLLVIGAPGGNWLQRTFFGPGAKLRGETDGGTVVVRWAPARAFQEMSDPVFVGPLRDAGDILVIHQEPVLAVVDRARLVGIVSREDLERTGPGVMVGAIMSEPISVGLDSELAEVEALADTFAGAPVPVVDAEGILVGSVYFAK